MRCYSSRPIVEQALSVALGGGRASALSDSTVRPRMALRLAAHIEGDTTPACGVQDEWLAKSKSKPHPQLSNTVETSKRYSGIERPQECNR
jgi:hypothetical protein